MRDAESAPAAAHDADDGGTDVKDGIRDRSVREVVERTRDVIRKTRELLDNSRDLLDRVRHRDDGKATADADAPSAADPDAPGEHDAGEASGSHAGADARPVDGRA